MGRGFRFGVALLFLSLGRNLILRRRTRKGLSRFFNGRDPFGLGKPVNVAPDTFTVSRMA